MDLSRNGIYGYDISTELLGTAGTLRIGYLRETPLFVMTKNSVAHDTVPYFMERFASAYTAQLQNFAQNVLQGRQAPGHDRRRHGGPAHRDRRPPGVRDGRAGPRGRGDGIGVRPGPQASPSSARYSRAARVWSS